MVTFAGLAAFYRALKMDWVLEDEALPPDVDCPLCGATPELQNTIRLNGEIGQKCACGCTWRTLDAEDESHAAERH